MKRAGETVTATRVKREKKINKITEKKIPNREKEKEKQGDGRWKESSQGKKSL
jgi:hypothetical protein